MKNIVVTKDSINIFFDGKNVNLKYVNNEITKNLIKSFVNTIHNATLFDLEKFIFSIKNTFFVEKGKYLYYNIENDKYYLKLMPRESIPNALAEIILLNEEMGLDYIIGNYINFAILLLANPNKDLKDQIMKFLLTYNFSITKYGYFTAYKRVKKMELVPSENVQMKYENNMLKELELLVKKVKSQKKSIKNFYVYHINNKYIASKSSNLNNNVPLGTLDFLVKFSHDLDSTTNNIPNTTNIYQNTTYLPIYVVANELSFKNKYVDEIIELGVPKRKKLEECDLNSHNDCSYGLHVGTVEYVNKFGDKNDTVLACLINPMNIIAAPVNNYHKIRVCEYFPYSIVKTNDNGEIIDNKDDYSEIDYTQYEHEYLNKLLSDLNKSQKNCVTIDNIDYNNYDIESMKEIINNRLNLI